MTLAAPLRAGLEAAYVVMAVLARRKRKRPLDWIRWLPLQDRYLRSASRFRLLRCGNQQGKTTVSLADLLLDALGEHPHRPCGEHGEYWVICASWAQSVSIQRKLRDLIPWERVKPGTEFSDIRGFRGRHPAVQVLHADGSYSLIRFKTTRQGTLSLAGATIRGALFDEPPTTESVYGEIVKRVQATGGWVAIAMTPIGADVRWIQALAESGDIEDIHSTLTPEAMVPVGADRPLRLPDGTPCDAAWIARVERETPPSELDIRVHGSFLLMAKGRYFSNFVGAKGQPGSHVSEVMPTGRVRICVGIDHGHRPGKQVILLVAVQEPTRPEESPRIWVLDEYTDNTGVATPKEDAIGLRDMLARNGLPWHRVDFAAGDLPHQVNTGHQKSNLDLMVQFGKLVGVYHTDLRPQIIRAYKPRQSVDAGCRFLFQSMSRPGHFHVNPRCKRTITALDNFVWRGTGTPDSEHADAVGALRYALQQQVFSGWTRGGPSGSGTVRFG